MRDIKKGIQKKRDRLSLSPIEIGENERENKGGRETEVVRTKAVLYHLNDS